MEVETETADLANLGLVQNIHLAEPRLARGHEMRRAAQVRAEVNATSESQGLARRPNKM